MHVKYVIITSKQKLDKTVITTSVQFEELGIIFLDENEDIWTALLQDCMQPTQHACYVLLETNARLQATS